MSEMQNQNNSLNQGNSFQKDLSSSEPLKNVSSGETVGPQPPQTINPMSGSSSGSSGSKQGNLTSQRSDSFNSNQNKKRVDNSSMENRQANKRTTGLWPSNLLQGWGPNFNGTIGAFGTGASPDLWQESKNSNINLNSDNFKSSVNSSSKASFQKNNKGNVNKNKNKVVSVTYEEIGLFPRSFSRVFDRFFKQIFSDVENLVIQEYRFYRYLFLTTIKTLCILFFVPFAVNFIAKTYLIRPITEYFWNTQQTEIFLNSYEQKRAFSELQEFEEKLYFESLLVSKNAIVSSPFLKASAYDFGRASNTNEAGSGLSSTEKLNTPSVAGGQLGSLEQQQSFRGITLSRYPSEAGAPDGYSTLAEGVTSTKSNISNIDLSLNNLTTGALELYPSVAGTPRSENSLQENAQKFKGSTAPTNLTAKQPDALYSSTTPNLPETLSSLQDKILELAIRYNNHSIEAITNFFADFLSLITLLYLLVSLEIQINITKSFLLEVFFGLDDSKKSLLILIMTDLLVGYHSSNLWELFFQFIFNHYGIPESQTGIFLLVATLPVLLDVLFKYLIFRHLNRSSPATVATYHAIIE